MSQCEEMEDAFQNILKAALGVRDLGDCRRERVGAALGVGGEVIMAAANGPPGDLKECEEGGCARCLDKGSWPSGSGHSHCTCIHAEMRVLLLGACETVGRKGSDRYVLGTTSRPCIACCTAGILVGVEMIVYLGARREILRAAPGILTGEA